MTFVDTPYGHMSMDDSAMAELGWRPGQMISGAQLHDGIAANARALCRRVEARGGDLDTSALAEMCGHKPLQ